MRHVISNGLRAALRSSSDHIDRRLRFWAHCLDAAAGAGPVVTVKPLGSGPRGRGPRSDAAAPAPAGPVALLAVSGPRDAQYPEDLEYLEDPEYTGEAFFDDWACAHMPAGEYFVGSAETVMDAEGPEYAQMYDCRDGVLRVRGHRVIADRVLFVDDDKTPVDAMVFAMIPLELLREIYGTSPALEGDACGHPPGRVYRLATRTKVCWADGFLRIGKALVDPSAFARAPGHDGP